MSRSPAGTPASMIVTSPASSTRSALTMLCRRCGECPAQAASRPPGTSTLPGNHAKGPVSGSATAPPGSLLYAGGRFAGLVEIPGRSGSDEQAQPEAEHADLFVGHVRARPAGRCASEPDGSGHQLGRRVRPRGSSVVSKGRGG
jgi:hypothetical protein